MNTIIIKCGLIFFFILWSSYSYIIFYKNSKLVYSYRRDFIIKTVALEFDGSLNARDLHINKIYQTDDNSLYDTNLIIKGYQWSKITSIHRLLFLNKKDIKNADEDDKIYYYLYLNNKVLFFNNQVFGLSLKEPPSKLYLYTDYFRYSTKIALLIVLLLWGILNWAEKKYIGEVSWSIIDSLPTSLLILFILLVVFF